MKKVFMLFAVVFMIMKMAAIAEATSENSGLFEPYVLHEVSSGADTVAVGDLNGDGRNDVAVTVSYGFNDPDSYKLFIYLQDENGELSEPVKMDSGCQYVGRPTSIDIGDINNGGFNEIIITCLRSNVTVFSVDPNDFSPENYMHWSYSTAESYTTELSDVYGNGVNEIVSAGWGTDTATIFAQELEGDFMHPPYGIFSNSTVLSVDHNGWDDLAVGDVDSNGLKDVVVMSGQGYGSYNFGIIHQNEGGWGEPIYYGEANQGDDLSHGIAVGDINGDGKDDVVVTRGGNKPYSFIDVYAQDDDGGLQPVATYPSYDLPYAVQISQVDYDDRNDIVVLHKSWDRIGVYLQDVNGELLPEELYETPRTQNYYPKAMAVGDVNGDGLNDILVASDTGLAILYHSPRPIPPISGCVQVENGQLAKRAMLWQRGENGWRWNRQFAEINEYGCYEFEKTVSGRFFLVIRGKMQ